MLELWSKKMFCGVKRLVDWAFPVLTANGTVGGDGYAVTMSLATWGPAYNITNPKRVGASQIVGCGSNPPSYILFYSPNHVYISEVYFYSINSWSSNASATVTIQIQGSSDGQQYDILNAFTVTARITDYGLANRDKIVTINSEKAYKYIRLYCSASNKNVDPIYTHVKISGQMEV